MDLNSLKSWTSNSSRALSFAGPPNFLYVSNIDTFMESFQLNRLSHSLAFVGPIIATVSKLLSGYLSDLSLGKHAAISSLIFILSGQTLIFTICLFETLQWERHLC